MISISKFIAPLLSVLVISFSANALDVRQALNEELQILTLLEPTVETVDSAQLYYFQESINEILTMMDVNVKAGDQELSFAAMTLLQALVRNYQASTSFFGWDNPPDDFSIYTPATEAPLKQLQASYISIQKSFGFDDSPYTTITESTFRKMQKLLKDLEQLPLDDETKKLLRSLWAPIGNVVAVSVAELGDTTCVYKEAQLVVLQIREIYPQLTQISSATAGYNMVRSLIGLNEIYAGFSKLDQTTVIGSCVP